MATRSKMEIHQLDVATAYLNGHLDEEIYMEVPDYTNSALEYVIEKKCAPPKIIKKAKKMLKDIISGNKVCKLERALYGLKQAGRCWYQRLNAELLQLGAKPTHGDPCVYVQGEGRSRVIVVVYVDDILLMSCDSEKINEVCSSLRRSFEIKDLGQINYCLGIEFSRDDTGVKMNQRGYIMDVLNRYGMSDCKPVSTPLEPGMRLSKRDGEDLENGINAEDDEKFPYRELVGALMYLAIATRPDIAHATSVLGQFNSCARKVHWQAAKRVLRYLRGTIDVGLHFANEGAELTGYVDADWASDTDDRRSYTGFVFTLNGGPVAWESRKQRTVALSSTEAEYMAISESCKEAMYLRRIIEDLGAGVQSSVQLFNDNQGAKSLAKNPVSHSRTKHIQVRHHFVREALSTDEVRLDYMPTEEMPADVLTKGLPRLKHWRCLKSLGIYEQ